MIITEIKFKHLKVRISEFEELIFDKNILPIYTTPTILKEVDARKTNKYRVETLNPNKNLNFKVITFNEIIEELTKRINKVAKDLELYYFADPSHYKTLPNKVKLILDKYKIIEKKKSFKDASFRLKKSITKKNKNLILNLIVFYKNYSYFSSKKFYKLNINYFNQKSSINKNLGYIFKKGKLNLKSINNVNNINTNLELKTKLFLGLIPTSKGALSRLEDKGWDLDLLSNRNKVSYRIKKLRPFKLKCLRRLRRLRRLRLFNTNLFLYRSNNVELIQKDQVNQGRNLSILNLFKDNLNKINKGAAINLLTQNSSLTNIIKLRINRLRNGNNINEINENINNKSINPYLLKTNYYSITRPLEKHTNNRVKFIINWIGDNLNNNKTDKMDKNFNSIKEDRLNFYNIKDIFLLSKNKPIKIPFIEDPVYISKNELDSELLNKKKIKLDEISLFNKNKFKSINKIILKRKNIKNRFKFKKRNKFKFFKYRRHYNNKFNYKFKYRNRNSFNKFNYKFQYKKFLKNKNYNYNFKNRNRNSFNNFNYNFFKNKNIRKFSTSLINNNSIKFNNFYSEKFPLKSPVNVNINNLYLFNNLIISRYKHNHINYNINTNTDKINLIQINNLPFAKVAKENLNLRLKALNFKIKIWNKKKKLSLDLFDKTSFRYVKSLIKLNKNNLVMETKKSIIIDKKKVNALSIFLYYIYYNKLKSLSEVKPWNKLASVLAFDSINKSTRNNISRHSISSEISNESKAFIFWTIIKLFSNSFNPLFASNSFNNQFVLLPGFIEKNWGLKSTLSLPNVRSGLNSQIKISRFNIDIESQNSYEIDQISNINYNEKNKLINFNQKIYTKSYFNKFFSKQFLNNNNLINKKFNYFFNKNQSITQDLFYNLSAFDNKRFLFLYFILPIFLSTLNNLFTLKEVNKFNRKNSINIINLVKFYHARVNENNTFNKRDALNNFKSNNVVKYFIMMQNINQLRSLFKLMFFSGHNHFSKFNYKNVNLVKYNKQVALNAYKFSHKNISNKLLPFINLYKYNLKISLIKKNKFYNNYNLKKEGILNNYNIFNNLKNFDLIKWSIFFVAQSLITLKKNNNFHSLLFIKLLEARGWDWGFVDLLYKEARHNKFNNPKFKQFNNLPIISQSINREALNVLNNKFYINKTNNIDNVNNIKDINNKNKLIKNFDFTDNVEAILQDNINFSNNNSYFKSDVKISDKKETKFNFKNKNIIESNSQMKIPDFISDSQESKEDKKTFLLTYFPGGRQISDWRNISKAIWQEELKFNFYYKKTQISLNLANNFANYKTNGIFAIIYVFKFWNNIKVTTIKSISALKIKNIFLNSPLYINKSNTNLTNLICATLIKFIDNLKYTIIDFIFKNIDNIYNLNFLNLKNINLFSLSKTIEFRNKNGRPRKFKNFVDTFPRNKKNLSYRLINNSFFGKEIKKKNKEQKYKFVSNLLNYSFVIDNLNKYFDLDFNFKFYSSNFYNYLFKFKLIYLIKHINNYIPFIFSFLFKIFNKGNKHRTINFSIYYFFLGFFNNNHILSGRTSASQFIYFTQTFLNYLLPGNHIRETNSSLSFIKFDSIYGNTKSVISRTWAPTWLYNSKLINSQLKLLIPYEKKKVLPGLKEFYKINLKNELEFKNNFNNLVDAKEIIIGKIRSIKLIELLDYLKEEIAIAEKLATLVRIASFTEFKNYANNNKFRKINSFKYLNKNNISKLNRITILHTIKSINKDFKFEHKLDSNKSSNLPITLLYYSKLKPDLSPKKKIFSDKIKGRNFKLKFSSKKNKYFLKPVNNKSIIYNKKNLAIPFASSTLRERTSGFIGRKFKLEPVLSAYLRELSIFNREIKGVINYYSRIIGYNFNYNTNKISSSVYDLLAAVFFSMRCLISRPIFIFSPDKISIQLFYFILVVEKENLKSVKRRLNSLKRYPSPYRDRLRERIEEAYTKKRLRLIKIFSTKSLKKIFSRRLKFLCRVLNKIFNKPVELNLIRLHYPSADSNILVNFMGIIINKIKFPKIIRKLFKGSIIKTLIKFNKLKFNDISIIPAFLTGLTIRVAGRIMTQRSKPRKTINFVHRGVMAKGKINYLNFARLTHKNKRGSYSISISAGQNYFK